MKNMYPKTVLTFFVGHSIFNYFQRLNYYNFGIILAKSIKLFFYKVHLSRSEQAKNHITAATQ